MKKSFRAVLLAVGISLISVSIWLLLNPIAARAESCTATCRFGSVTCNGAQCRAVDYDGCYYTDPNGVEKRKRCDVAGEEGGGGGGGHQPILP